MKRKHLIIFLYSLIIGILLWSVIRSGYLYTFDFDELFHVHTVFLLQKGLLPYRDFVATYTVLFHWFLTPISYFTGFTINFIHGARIVMIALFIFRLFLIALLVRKLFGTRVMYFFIPLYLFDPFTVFSGMQIRPDNLMMTLYVAGIYFFLLWFIDHKKFALPISGLLLSLSAVTLMKNLFATVVIIAFTFFLLLKKRSYRELIIYVLAGSIPVIFVFLYGLVKGILPAMIEQIFVDAKLVNDVLRYPLNILNFYWPTNNFLYGFSGQALTWRYELLLPLLAFAGMFHMFIQPDGNDKRRQFIIWFTIACAAQWLSLWFVRSVFLQYFLSVSWFLAIFSAAVINKLYEMVIQKHKLKLLIQLLILGMSIGGLLISIQANKNRSDFNYQGTVSNIEKRWSIIPADAYVFPGYLFRLSKYPLGYGTNFTDTPPQFFIKYGIPSIYLQKNIIKYLVIDPFNFTFLDSQSQDYISSHYKKHPEASDIWVLK